MPHNHKVGEKETGPEIIDPDNNSKHWHMLEGDRTSTENFGPKHTHTINGQLTGPPIEPEGNKMKGSAKREFKFESGFIVTHKEIKQDEHFDDHLGIVEGYIATFDKDRGDFLGVKDQFVPGAFLASIADHLQRNRSIRLKSGHRTLIGQFPINSVREDEKGLFGRAEINLKVPEGAAVYALVKQGAISDFSIGFSIDGPDGATESDNLRTITKAIIWEGSLVDEPMNPFANVTDIKAVVPFQDLPLADRDMEWDAAEAVKRVREFTDSEEAPTERYKKEFVWYDKENSNVFSGYKLPIADVVDGKLKVVPNAIFAAADAVLISSRSVPIPEADKSGVIRHLERYYAKMDLPSPFGKKSQFVTAAEAEKMTPREVENALQDGKQFSKKAAKIIVSRLGKKLQVDKPTPDVDNQELKELLDKIKSIKI